MRKRASSQLASGQGGMSRRGVMKALILFVAGSRLGRVMGLGSLGTAAGTSSGCGAAGGIAAALCIPCGFVEVFLGVVGVVLVAIFWRDDNGEPCNCSPPPEPPPEEPPPPGQLWFDLINARTGKCPFDVVKIYDPDTPGLPLATVAHAIAPEQPGDTVLRLDPKRMWYPQDSNPVFQDGSTIAGSHVNRIFPWQPNFDGSFQQYYTGSKRLRVVVEFNTNPIPEPLDVSQWMWDHGMLPVGVHPMFNPGTVLGVAWDDVEGAHVTDYIA